MALDLTTVDHLLRTTRAVRKRLDLSRAVEPEVIEECLDLAIQAPTGSNSQGWRFVVVTDAARRQALADVYRKGWDAYRALRESEAAGAGITIEPQMQRVVDSSHYLAQHLHEVPVHVVPCIFGRDMVAGGNATAAGIYGSIFPAVWSFQLALRSRGLGSVLTTLHLLHEAEAAAVLGIPDEVLQVCLLPVAYFTGDDFKPAARRDIGELTYWDGWKQTR